MLLYFFKIITTIQLNLRKLKEIIVNLDTAGSCSRINSGNTIFKRKSYFWENCLISYKDYLLVNTQQNVKVVWPNE